MIKDSSNSMANFFDKTSIKFNYLASIITFLAISKKIWAFRAKYIDICDRILRETIEIIKASLF